MAMKHCTKIRVSLIGHKGGEVSILSYFMLSTPVGSTITQRKVIESSCPKNMHMYNSCDIVALRENFVDRPESYDLFSGKSCVFFAHGLGVYFSIPLHNLAQSKVSKIPKTFTYYSRTITNLTKFDFPLPRDQTSRS
jgi:hypothetical protein